MKLNHLNLRVKNAGACRDFYQEHFGFQPAFEAEGGYFVGEVEDFRPGEQYVTFRCWDPDGTEIEVFWDAA